MKLKRQTGQSLIELMVALALGLILSGFIVAIFQSIRRASSYNNNLITVQETGRSVFHLLQRDLDNATELINPESIPENIQAHVHESSGVLYFKKGAKKLVYYLSATKRKDEKGDAVFELDRRDLSISRHNQTAMLDGVQNFNINYGKITEGNLNFVPAQHITIWSDVKLVKVSFIAESNTLKRTFEFVLRVASR